MNLNDTDLVDQLARRDGPMRTESMSHRSARGNCRYRELYPDVECPWCVAEDARLARQASGS